MEQPYEILLSGPGKNAMSSTMLRWLEAELERAEGRAVMVHGTGDAFSAGLDLKEIATLAADPPAMLEFLRALERTMVAYYTYPGPVVACVNGHAIAGGCVLMLCADYRIAQASAKTKIGINEVALGFEFPPHILQIVRDRVPPRSRERVFLAAELFGVEDAMKHGLIDEIADDALAFARKRASELAALPRKAYQATKRAIRATLVAPGEQDRQLREALAAWTSTDVRARVLAHLDRVKGTAPTKVNRT
jgi:enoyl-CoA hydratase/carnithine racemase